MDSSHKVKGRMSTQKVSPPEETSALRVNRFSRLKVQLRPQIRDSRIGGLKRFCARRFVRYYSEFVEKAADP